MLLLPAAADVAAPGAQPPEVSIRAASSPLRSNDTRTPPRQPLTGRASPALAPAARKPNERSRKANLGLQAQPRRRGIGSPRLLKTRARRGNQ